MIENTISMLLMLISKFNQIILKVNSPQFLLNKYQAQYSKIKNIYIQV